MTSSERAEQIRDKALKAVADRITELGAEFHPAAIPIVAANVAMHVMADELLDDMRLPDALVVGHVARLTAWGSGERRYLCPACAHQEAHGWTEGECLCGEVER